MNQDHFFIEEEALDPRIKTSKMLSHFKKTEIQSVSFTKGLKDKERHEFIKIFTNLARFPNAEAMIPALQHHEIDHIRINHVFYKKVTADDEVVDRRLLKSNATAGTGSSMQEIARSVLAEELETTISLRKLLDSPETLSRALLEANAPGPDDNAAGSRDSGKQLLRHLRKIKSDIEQNDSDAGPFQPDALAEAVVCLNNEIIDGIKSKKADGIRFTNETEIRREAEELTDKVLINLVRKEYHQDNRSMQGFIRILRRLIPRPDEIKRLMPKIREVLLADDISQAAFRQFTQKMSDELQNENVGTLLAESAEKIGVSGEELLREVNLDPKGAAELIYLASEIRKGTGDEQILSDLLVDYIERIGSKIALESTENSAAAPGESLRQVVSGVEAELLSRLKNKDIDAGVLDRVTRRLSDRLETCIQKLQSQWTLQTKNISETGSEEPTTVFNILEEGVEEGDELNAILKQIRAKYDGQGLDENDYSTIYKEISRAKKKQFRRQEKGTSPRGILNRRSTLYILEKEIARSIRYGSHFSVLVISIVKVLPETRVSPGSLSRSDVNNAILEELARQVRNTDIIGQLDKRKLVALMPMTIEAESKTAMRRILKAIQNADLQAGDNRVKVRLAGAITTFDHQRTPTLTKFVQLAENEIFDMVNRLRNIQSLY